MRGRWRTARTGSRGSLCTSPPCSHKTPPRRTWRKHRLWNYCGEFATLYCTPEPHRTAPLPPIPPPYWPVPCPEGSPRVQPPYPLTGDGSVSFLYKTLFRILGTFESHHQNLNFLFWLFLGHFLLFKGYSVESKANCHFNLSHWKVIWVKKMLFLLFQITRMCDEIN